MELDWATLIGTGRVNRAPGLLQRLSPRRANHSVPCLARHNAVHSPTFWHWFRTGSLYWEAGTKGFHVAETRSMIDFLDNTGFLSVCTWTSVSPRVQRRACVSLSLKVPLCQEGALIREESIVTDCMYASIPIRKPHKALPHGTGTGPILHCLRCRRTTQRSVETRDHGAFSAWNESKRLWRGPRASPSEGAAGVLSCCPDRRR